MGFGLHFNLDDLYRPNFPYWANNFDEKLDNARTGHCMSGTVHHCGVCKKTITKDCYYKGHMALCVEWITVNGVRRMCGQRYCVRSKGCGSHGNAHGLNKLLTTAASNQQSKIISLDDFKDPEPIEEESDEVIDPAKVLKDMKDQVFKETEQNIDNAYNPTSGLSVAASDSFLGFNNAKSAFKKAMEWKRKDAKQKKNEEKNTEAETEAPAEENQRKGKGGYSKAVFQKKKK